MITKRVVALSAIFLLGPVYVPAAVNIDVRFRYQTMQGFGTSERVFDDPHVFENFDPVTARAATVLTTAQQDDVLDRLYSDLKLTWVRPAIDAGIEPVNDNNDPEVTDLSKFNFAWKRNDAHVDYVRRAMLRGVRGFFLSPFLRESWMGSTSSNDVAEYVEWCMAMIRRWRVLGIDLPYFSLANEPGGTGNPLSGPFLRDAIKKMGLKLRAEGFATMFVISDDLNPTEAYERCSVILQDREARKYVGAIASHLYGEPVSGMARLGDLAARYRLPLWMTEFSRAELGVSALDYAEQVIHPLIADYNVSVLMSMWGFFGQWEPPGTHLITLTYNEAKYLGYKADEMYYVLGQYSRFVPWDSVRVKATSTNHALKVTAYLNGNTLSIVVINNTDEATTEKFGISALPGIVAVQATRTSSTESWAALPPISADGSGFSARVAPRSITTFTAKAPFSITNSASLLPGAVSSGELITVSRSGLDQEIAAGTIPTLSFDGEPAQVSIDTTRQVTALVPQSVAGKVACSIELTSQTGIDTIVVPVKASSPALFAADGSGQGQGAILNENGDVNSESNPALRGSIVSLFGTGFSSTAQSRVDPVSVLFGAKPADILYVGMTNFAGLLQINARIPAVLTPGAAVPVMLSTADAISPTGITVAVQ